MGTKKDDRGLGERGRDTELKGIGDQIKGRVKDAAGGLLDDSSLQAEGKWDKTKGKAKEAFGELEQKAAQHARKRPSHRDLGGT